MKLFRLQRIISLRFLKSRNFQISFRNLNNYHQKITQSYYFMHGDFPLISSTVGQLLEDSADSFGDDMCFISDHQGVSANYSDFRKQVNKLASGLLACGLQKGDRIAVCAPNCYEWPVLQFATAKAGMVLVTLNPALRPKEIEYCLKKVKCKALVVWDVLKKQNFFEILLEVIPELETVKCGKIRSSNLPFLETIIMISKQRNYNMLYFDDVWNMENKETTDLLHSIEKHIQFDEPINIQFTSGTTGQPKGAILSHHNIISNSLVTGRRLGYFLQKPVICCQVPLFHCFGSIGCNLISVMFGGTGVYPSVLYDPAASLKAVHKYKCSMLYGTPTMMVDSVRIQKERNEDVSSLKQALIGGAAPSSSLMRDVKETFHLYSVSIAYGSTENSPCVAVNGFNDDFRIAENRIIPLLEYVECKVVDSAGRLVPVGAEGELLVRGHGVFIGYFDDPKATAEAVDSARWYRTGDLCVMDDEGCIKISGRKKDMILRGGENIYPLEIENFLHTHPAVLEANVIGVPDERMGEEVCAWVCLKDGAKLSEDELKAFCKGKISHFKIPRYVMFVTEFPKTTSGKIKKFEMVKVAIEKLNLKK